MTETRTRPAPKRLRPVRLVDADVHPMILRPALFERMSEEWRGYVQRFGMRTTPITEFYPRARGGGNRVDAWPEAPGSVPGSDREFLARQLLDEYDIDFAVLNALNMQDCNESPGLAGEVARTLNDWLREDWLDWDPRLLGTIVIPHEHPEVAVREIERCAADRRWVQTIFPTAAHDAMGSRKYWPIYEAAAAHGLPVAFHTGGLDLHHGSGWASYYLEEHVGYALAMQYVLQSLICEGVFDTFENLKVVLTEGGALWTASLRWTLDGSWALLRDEVRHLRRSPSEYIRDHVWYTTQPMEEPDDERQFLQAMEHGQLRGRLLFASDYPHWDFDSPAQALPNSLSKEVRSEILAGTACALYRLPTEREVPAGD